MQDTHFGEGRGQKHEGKYTLLPRLIIVVLLAAAMYFAWTPISQKVNHWHTIATLSGSLSPYAK